MNSVSLAILFYSLLRPQDPGWVTRCSHEEGLLKHTAEPHPSFWFRRFGAGLLNIHFQHILS